MDLLLRESARIVADMVELQADMELLDRKFAALDSEEREEHELP